MKIKILKDRGIYVAGKEVEMSYPQGQQWINSGFAELVVPEAKPKKAKPKAEESKEEKPAAEEKG